MRGKFLPIFLFDNNSKKKDGLELKLLLLVGVRGSTQTEVSRVDVNCITKFCRNSKTNVIIPFS